MSNFLLRIVAFSCFLSLLAVQITWAVAADPQHSFKVTIESIANMEAQGKIQKIDTNTVLAYSWKREAKERVLSFDSMMVKVNADDKPLMNTFMSREKLTNTTDGTTEEVPFDKAPDALKSILQDSFGVPMCKVQVDANGKEEKRTVVAPPGAKDLINNGAISNAVLFHPPYMKNQDQWQSDAEMSMGNGGYAKGTLTYKKMPGGIVKVTGEFKNDLYTPPGGPVSLKDALYKVDGEQTYDASQQEWAKGKLSIDLSFQLVASNQPIGSCKGTMKIGFEKLPGK